METKNANRDKELIKIIGVVLATWNNSNGWLRHNTNQETGDEEVGGMRRK